MYLRNLVESCANSSIIPNANTVSTQPLTGKVKSEKNFVFFIKCSKWYIGSNNEPMFYNHTTEKAFDIFESKYKDALYHHYTHLSEFVIHCYTFDQYSQLPNVPNITNCNNDTFAYAIYCSKEIFLHGSL